MSEYLKPSTYCKSDDPEIKQLALKITRNKKNDKEKAKALFEWVRDKIEYRITKIVGAKKILKRNPKYGSSFDKTNLLIALCRSIGIPARYVLLNCDIKVKKPNVPTRALHYVAEIFVNNRWVIADPTFSKSISSVVDISEWGKPTWSRVYKIEKTASLSKFKIMLMNFIMPFIPSVKKIYKAIEESRVSR
ncbi:MAG: transglutaminase-like domain-containing protein [Candidatus Aenigmatarchaeota archaeon]